MGIERASWCRECGQYFNYPADSWRGRKKAYCPKCEHEHKRKANVEKQRRFRKSHKGDKKTSAHKQPAGQPVRLVAVGSREDTERATRQPARKGLYSELPEPGRTIKRKAVGLP